MAEKFHLITRTPEERKAFIDGYRSGVRTCAEHGEDFAIRTMHAIEKTAIEKEPNGDQEDQREVDC